MRYYVAGYGGKVVETDFDTWTRWLRVIGGEKGKPFAEGGARVALDVLPGGDEVSTIFLGMIPPATAAGAFFDTVHIPADPRRKSLCAGRKSGTLDEARAAHAEVGAAVKAAPVPPKPLLADLVRKAGDFCVMYEAVAQVTPPSRTMAGGYEVCREFGAMAARIGGAATAMKKVVTAIRAGGKSPPAPVLTTLDEMAAVLDEMMTITAGR